MECVSKHFGVPGKRGRWLAVYLNSRSFKSEDYNTREPTLRWLHKFSVGGSVAVWWTGKPLDLEQGEQVVLIGTVKRHSVYQGTEQTELQRCDIHPVAVCEACGQPVIEKDKKCPSCKAPVGLSLFVDQYGK